jgi:hypothetical protein
LERISPPVSVRFDPNLVIQRLSKGLPPDCRVADRELPVDRHGIARQGVRKLTVDHSTGAAFPCFGAISEDQSPMPTPVDRSSGAVLYFFTRSRLSELFLVRN